MGLESALLREGIIYWCQEMLRVLVPLGALSHGLESSQPPWTVCEQVMMWAHSPCTGKGTLRAGQPVCFRAWGLCILQVGTQALLSSKNGVKIGM